MTLSIEMLMLLSAIGGGMFTAGIGWGAMRLEIKNAQKIDKELFERVKRIESWIVKIAGRVGVDTV